MRDILRKSNLDLFREIKRLEAGLVGLRIIEELNPYYNWLYNQVNLLRDSITKNLHYLNLNNDDILEDILSWTQKFTRTFQLLNSRLAGPIFRSCPSDSLSLKILTWLHSKHPQTNDIPLGLVDGEFSIWPEPNFPIIYFMPTSAQRGLLYLPLFFHEFGHLLYACHKPEMDVLVGELQKEIEDLLRGAFHRNDLYAEEDVKKQRIIVETWYEWTQEFFCDVVGLNIGGPCFIKAFSIYLRMTGRAVFQQSFEELINSTHPVAWIRARLLVDHSRELGLKEEAQELEYEWNTIAKSLKVSEDYYGFYDDDFLPLINRTLKDMLIEADPNKFKENEISSTEYNLKSSSPVHLLNAAWKKFLGEPKNYQKWEKENISNILGN